MLTKNLVLLWTNRLQVWPKGGETKMSGDTLFEQKPTFSICTSEKRRRWKSKHQPRGIFHFPRMHTQRLRITRDLTQRTRAAMCRMCIISTYVDAQTQNPRPRVAAWRTTLSAGARRWQRADAKSWVTLFHTVSHTLHATGAGSGWSCHFQPKQGYPLQKQDVLSTII